MRDSQNGQVCVVMYAMGSGGGGMRQGERSEEGLYKTKLTNSQL